MKRIGLIPRNRLIKMPQEVWCLHEYCFFLHDECVRMLVDYEQAEAHMVNIDFKDSEESEKFMKMNDENSPIDTLEKLGYDEEVRRVIINMITAAMVSDCVQHICEALKCFEKRKVIVGFNLLRKPLKDSLLYLSWVLGDEEAFYKDFMEGIPEKLQDGKHYAARLNILSKAIEIIDFDPLIDAQWLNEILYDKSSDHGLEMWFQHAVHLVTTRHPKLLTSPQNFNFIFKDPLDDDIYHSLYNHLPTILLFLSHVICALYDRMHPMPEGPKTAFRIRSMEGFSLVNGPVSESAQSLIGGMIEKDCSCGYCGKKLSVTDYNYARILFTESARCTYCRRDNDFPFSYMFDDDEEE